MDTEKTGKLIEIPNNHDILWYHNESSPWIRIFNPNDDKSIYKRTSLGSARKWLKINLNDNVYFMFDGFEKIHNKVHIKGTYITLFFESNDDYVAFKVVFPELCRKD